jgi:hypothetical protein
VANGVPLSAINSPRARGAVEPEQVGSQHELRQSRRYTVGPRGSRTTVGIPGTGMSWSEASGRRLRRQNQSGPATAESSSALGCTLLIIIGVLGVAMCSPSSNSPGSPSERASSDRGAAGGAVRTAWIEPSVANCRVGASGSASVSERLSQGTEVTVGEEKSGWSRLHGGSGECWVAFRLLADAPTTVIDRDPPDDIASERISFAVVSSRGPRALGSKRFTIDVHGSLGCGRQLSLFR